MSDANRLLEIIERDIVAHGGDLGGWTRLSDESLQLFDGRVTLRAEVHQEEQAGDNVVHAHVFTTLREHEDETGFDADLVHEVESVSTIAFGRLLFESRGVQCSPTVIRARRDGRIETDVPLMSIPAYSRARGWGLN